MPIDRTSSFHPFDHNLNQPLDSPMVYSSYPARDGGKRQSSSAPSHGFGAFKYLIRPVPPPQDLYLWFYVYVLHHHNYISSLTCQNISDDSYPELDAYWAQLVLLYISISWWPRPLQVYCLKTKLNLNNSKFHLNITRSEIVNKSPSSEFS